MIPAPKPLTLALSQRERGLDRVVLASYADLKYRIELRIEKTLDRLLFPSAVFERAPICSLSPSPPWGERAGVRGAGSHWHNKKPLNLTIQGLSFKR
ncbi:hypothetical protein BK672_23135 [Pseudomonas fluorescens]|uniref:Uncharacterized protein n=1 Tax=Pseudomonas fluorescens TaxID=294 RepID=A0A423MW79_PSEFL|nr:hypothetical protein BK672_23135 [Pseudomonas fluorescens]